MVAPGYSTGSTRLPLDPGRPSLISWESLDWFSGELFWETGGEGGGCTAG